MAKQTQPAANVTPIQSGNPTSDTTVTPKRQRAPRTARPIYVMERKNVQTFIKPDEVLDFLGKQKNASDFIVLRGAVPVSVGAKAVLK